MIDVLTGDNDISALLEGSLHMGLNLEIVPGADGPENDDNQEELQQAEEQCSFLCCVTDPAHDLLKKFVNNFWKQIQRHHLKPADLLLVSCLDTDAAYFLGILLKKPLVQTLVLGVVTDNEARYDLSSGAPAVLTAHQLFLTCLREGGLDVKVDFEAWRCDAFLADGCFLKSNPCEKVCSFSVSSEPLPAVKKPKFEAPFGWTEKKRPRKPRQKRAAKPKASRKPRPVRIRGDYVPSSGSEVDAASRSSHSESNSEDVNEESERVVPVSASAAEEVQAAAAEIEEADVQRAETAEAIRLNEMPGPSSSFFSKELGMKDVVLALSGRSACLCCKQFIAKGTVRYSWYYSKVRPHGWLHAGCVLQYVDKQKIKQLPENTLRCLRDIQRRCAVTGSNSASSTSKSQPVVSEISEWTSKLVDALEKRCTIVS